MKSSYQKVKEIFRNHNGILRTAQAKRLGIHQQTLSRMYHAGLLVKVSRGIYRLPDAPPLGNPDMVTISLRVPEAIICLISALAFHNLTTQIPYKVYIALPRPYKRPHIEYPPIDTVWLNERSYHAGIDEHVLDNVRVRIYNREKTVADCFKFRNKIGNDVAIEALKDYFRDPNVNVEQLLHFSKINRVTNTIRPYIEAMI
jgi:predicted transcriptional regulator of viral defense system